MNRSQEIISAVDHAWLRMDSPTNPMVITAMLVLEGRVDAAEVERLVARLVDHAPRFRRRVAPTSVPLGRAHWEDDPAFRVAAHVHRVALPQPGGDRELEIMVSELMSTPLDHTRPLWQAHVIEGYGDGSALVFRVHHAMGDGVALVSALLAVVGDGALPPPEVGLAKTSVPPHAADLVKAGAAYAQSLGHLLLIPFDAPSVLKGAHGTQKVAAWSRPFPLDRVKAGARAANAKVNDVLMSCVAGAVRRYLAGRDALRDGQTMRALVPVYLRGTADVGELGNHFGLVFLDLPIDVEDPVPRVAVVKRRMDEIKGSPEAIVAIAVLGAMGVASEQLEHLGVELFSRKGTVMITNVPGPPAHLIVAGRRLSRMMVWAPTAGHIGVGLSLLSYAGSVSLGVSADAGLVPDPTALAVAFDAEVELALSALA